MPKTDRRKQSLNLNEQRLIVCVTVFKRSGTMAYWKKESQKWYGCCGRGNCPSIESNPTPLSPLCPGGQIQDMSKISQRLAREGWEGILRCTRVASAINYQGGWRRERAALAWLSMGLVPLLSGPQECCVWLWSCGSGAVDLPDPGPSARGHKYIKGYIKPCCINLLPEWDISVCMVYFARELCLLWVIMEYNVKFALLSTVCTLTAGVTFF